MPECRDYSCETEIAEALGKAGRLNLTAYVYHALGEWIHNARVIGRAARNGAYDLIVGDETCEVVVAHVIGLRPLPETPFIVLYDLLDMDVTTGSILERLGAWGLNFIWSRQHRLTGRNNNGALFIGEPSDIPDRRFGLFIPNRRRYADRHLEFFGYVLTFHLASLPPKNVLRAELCYGPGPLVIYTVGGTAVGRELLELCGQAYSLVLAELPGLRMVLVSGPRIDPKGIDAPEGVERRGMVRELYRHFTAADLVITQGGGTTTLELTVLRVPFLFFPLKAQAEQEVTIANRVARHQAGFRMSLSETTPHSLARAIVQHIGESSSYSPIPHDGASRAADIMLKKLELFV